MKRIVTVFSFSTIAVLLFSCFCFAWGARPVPMEIRPLGVLDDEDYQQLKIVANQAPARVGERVGAVCAPTQVYYVDSGYDFSKAKSIYIPDFESHDPRADERVTSNVADELGELLKKKAIFERVERSQPSDADIELRAVVAKYQGITGSQTAKAMVTGTAYCGFYQAEIRIIDTKSEKKIGAIQINHITARAGGIFTWAGSRRPETQIPGFLASMLEKMKAGQTAWTSAIAFDCTRDDGTDLMDSICK